jgi:lysozyme
LLEMNLRGPPIGPNPLPGPNAARLIARKEGFEPVPANDPVGISTVGYGHKVLPGETFSQPLTQAAAVALFQADMKTKVVPFMRSDTIKAALNQNQVDALASLIFNIGGGSFSTSSLLKGLNRGNFGAAARQFGEWNKAWDAGAKKMVELPGLTIRRAEERALFESSGLP